MSLKTQHLTLCLGWSIGWLQLPGAVGSGVTWSDGLNFSFCSFLEQKDLEGRVDFLSLVRDIGYEMCYINVSVLA